MKKGIFLYNPYSGNKTIVHFLDTIIERFQEANKFIYLYRLDRRESEIVKFIKKEEFDFIVVSGGDGSLNSCVEMLINNEINIPIGIIPTGTCNDFARCLNIPKNIENCIDIILKNEPKKIDVGLVNNKKYFLSTFAGGLFAGTAVNTQGNLKEIFGPIGYYMKAMEEMITLKSFHMNFETDDGIYSEEIVLFIVLNGKHAAGFSNISVEARMNDGLMDLVIIRKCTHVEIPSIFFNVMNNEYENDKNILVMKTKKFIINEISENVAFTVDGEKHEGDKFDVEILNKKIRVFE